MTLIYKAIEFNIRGEKIVSDLIQFSLKIKTGHKNLRVSGKVTVLLNVSSFLLRDFSQCFST